MPFFGEYSPLKPLDHIGFWGPVTLTIDWCEENYILSPFFAEFVNATTNLSFFFLSMYHLYSARRNRHGLLFTVISLGMGLVGLGSWLFHMTLRYEFQLMDELPMIYFTLIPFGYIFSCERSQKAKIAVYVATLSLVTALTVIYCSVYTNPTLHQLSYAILNFSIIIKSVLMVRKYVTNTKVRHFLYWKLTTSISQFLFGFLIWNLDTLYCQNLITVRREYLKLPLGILLEGHGWWHIFTSLGIYNFIIYNEVLSIWFENKQNDYVLVYRFGLLAEVVLKEKEDWTSKSHFDLNPIDDSKKTN